MSKDKTKKTITDDLDTMLLEYDFSKAVRGATAKRYSEGTNVVVIPTDIMDVFPDANAVSEALRALAPLMRHQRQLASGA